MPLIPIVIGLIAIGGSVSGAVKADKERKALEAAAALERERQRQRGTDRGQPGGAGDLPGWVLPAVVVGGLLLAARR